MKTPSQPVSLAFPVQNLMIAVSTGTGVGVNALLSRNLGAKIMNALIASRNRHNSGAGQLPRFCRAGPYALRNILPYSNRRPEIIAYGTDYLLVVTGLSFGLFGQIIGERLLQATGRTFYTMITQGLGAIINIILDPIIRISISVFPAMGTRGAALATVIGQIIAAILGFYFNHKVNHEIHISFKQYRPTWSLVGKIYAIGIPSILMSSVGSVMTFCMNKILIAFTSTATAVFGVYYKLQSFIFMPVFGLNNGMVPIISYNYGAQKKDRIHQTIKLGVIYATILMVVGFLIFELCPDLLMRMFNASDTMLAMGRTALRVIALHFIIAGFDIVASTVFQALGRSIYSLIVSLARQLLVLVPVAYFLSLTET